VFGAATIQLFPNATMLRLKLPAHRHLFIDLMQHAWRLGVSAASAAVHPITIRAVDGQLSLQADSVGGVVTIADPETGADLLVGTQKVTGEAITTPRQMPEFNLLPTLQGVVVEPLTDRLVMRTAKGGFLLTGGAQGLSMTPSSTGTEAESDAIAMTRRFNLRNLTRDALVARLRDQVGAAAAAAPLARGRLRQAEAETLVSLGFGAEAQAMLHLAATDDPAVGETADAIGLGAVAALLDGRIADTAGIDDPRLNGSDEVTLWRGVREAELAPGSPLAAADFASTAALLGTYSDALRQRLLPMVLETMIEGGQTAAAARMLAHQPADDPTLALARAMLLAANGDTDGALALYDKLANGQDRLLHAKAAVRAVELRLSAGRIDAAQAADGLERLLYSWRGDQREFALRERIADLRERAGAWSAALAMLHETEVVYPDDKAALHARMTAAFARMLADPALDRLAPLELVALVDANADLLPKGPAAEALDERLADRLVALDLPRQAAPVLEKLMTVAPSEAAKAGFGTRLAEVRLRDGDAAGAVAALTASGTPAASASPTAPLPASLPAPLPLPAPLIERRAMLEAAARARLGDTVAAVNELAAVGTPAADLARAAIFEQVKDWRGAEHALADYVGKMIPPNGALDVAQQRILVSYATAAAQAGDDATLTLLRTNDGPRIPSGAFGDMFRLLTAAPVQTSTDLPRAAREAVLAHDLPKALDALKPPIGRP
jgi:hypothetical protein